MKKDASLNFKKVYLACPYTCIERVPLSVKMDTESARADLATLAAAYLSLCGRFLVYSPVTHGHAMNDYSVPGDWDFWQAHCLSFLERWADALFVLRLDGWEKSKGVQAEIAAAKCLGLEIDYLEITSAGDIRFVKEASHA